MTTPAGWYPDTEVPGGLRYWDGSIWTEHRTPPAGAPEPAAAEPADIDQPTSVVSLPPEGATTVIPTQVPAQPEPEPEPEPTPEPVAETPAAGEPAFPSWETPPMPSWDEPAAATQVTPIPDTTPSYQPPSAYEPPTTPPSYEPPTTPPSYEPPASFASSPPAGPPPGYGPPTTPPPGYGAPSTPPADYGSAPSYAAGSYLPPGGPPGVPPTGAPGGGGGGGGGNNKLILGIVGAVAAVVLVAALVLVYFFVIKDDDKTSTASTSTSKAASSESETSESSEPSETSESSETSIPAPPGGAVTDGPFSFTVANVDVYDTIESADIEGLEVAADGVFLIVEVDVTNVSDAQASFLLTQATLNAGGEIIRTDDEGNFYANGNVAFDVAPGETFNAAIAFDVPDGTQAESIHVYGDLMSAGVDLPLS